MNRLLTSLCFLILATGCDKFSGNVSPSPLNAPPAATADLVGMVSQMTADGAVPVDGATVQLIQRVEGTDPVSGPARVRPAGRGNDVIVLTSTVSNIEGRYEFDGINLGTYAIRVSKAGFVLYDSGDFQVASSIDIDAELTVDVTATTSRIKGVRR